MVALEKFFTKKEKERALKRFKILKLLKNGLTVREVAKRLQVSTATVVKTRQRFTQHQKSGAGFTKRKQGKKIKRSTLSSKKMPNRRWVWG